MTEDFTSGTRSPVEGIPTPPESANDMFVPERRKARAAKKECGVDAAREVAEQQLVALDRALNLVNAASDPADATPLIEHAEILRCYAKKAKLGLELQNRCAELKLRAERRVGQFLEKMDKNPGGRSTVPTLSHVGIERHESSRWQRIAGIPEELFDQYVHEVGAAGKELTEAGLLALRRKRNQSRPSNRPITRSAKPKDDRMVETADALQFIARDDLRVAPDDFVRDYPDTEELLILAPSAKEWLEQVEELATGR